MSEQNVDHAFDPEARQAQAEFNAYLQSRPEDEFSIGVVNGADGPHPTLGSEYYDYYDASRDAHYEATQAAGDYEKMSISKLAKELGQAELDEDKTRIGDIEDVLYTKMDEFVAKAGEKAGKQSEEDRTEAGNNLLSRVAKIKEGYKASVVGTEAGTDAVKQSPADVKKAADTALVYNKDRAVKPGEISTLADKVEELGRRAAAAKAAGNEAEADRVGAEWKAASDELNDLIGKVADRHDKAKAPAGATEATEAAKSPYEGMTPEEINERLRQLEQDVVDQLTARDAEGYYAALKELSALRGYMEDEGIVDFAELPPPPTTDEQPAVTGEEGEEADEESQPAKVGRIRRAWRNLSGRAQHAAAGNYDVALGRNKKPATPADPAEPIDPSAPFNPINEGQLFDADAYLVESANADTEKDKNRKGLYIGAAALAAAGIVLTAVAAYKGHDLMNQFEQVKVSAAEAAARKAQNAHQAREQIANAAEAVARRAQNAKQNHETALDNLAYYLKGLKAVEVQTGLKPGQPGFDEAVQKATEYAWKLEQAKAAAA